MLKKKMAFSAITTICTWESVSMWQGACPCHTYRVELDFRYTLKPKFSNKLFHYRTSQPRLWFSHKHFLCTHNARGSMSKTKNLSQISTEEPLEITYNIKYLRYVWEFFKNTNNQDWRSLLVVQHQCEKLFNSLDRK